jgi:transcriptional regulator with GAF, ATPase, and Fis domain
MFQNPAVWISTGVFLTVLILVRRYRAQLGAESPEGFKYFSAGLSLLTLAALAKLFYTEGLLKPVPFISDSMFFDLVYWISVMAGGSMVINGASNWLPLTRRRNQSGSGRSRHSDLLRQVQQLVGVESRIDTVLSNTLLYMKEQMALSYGAVFKYSHNDDQIHLAATTTDFPLESEELEEVVAVRFAERRPEEKAFDLERCLVDCLPSELKKPAAVILIEVRGYIAGSFVLWNREGQIDADERQNLQLAADIIAHKIDRDRLLIARQSDQRRMEWLASLETSVCCAQSSRRKVAAFAQGLHEMVPYDTLAVTIVPGAGRRMIRYTTASIGSILMERTVETPLSSALTAPAYCDGQTVVFGDLGVDQQPDYREIIPATPVRSLIAIPVRVAGDIRVVLTLASDRRDFYDRPKQGLLEMLRPLVVQTVQADVMDMISRRELSRLEKLSRIAALTTEADTPQALVNSVACLAVEETGADIVRVARLDETGLFLESQALVSSVGQAGTVPADGQMILALMPLHDRAVQAGQTAIVLTQGEDGLSAMEAHQIFSTDVQQAMIVPLMHNGRAVGVITAASLSAQPAIFGETSQRVFLETLALISAPLLYQARGERRSAFLQRLNEVPASIESGRRLQLVESEISSESMVGNDHFDSVR